MKDIESNKFSMDELQIIKAALNNIDFVSDEHNTIKDRLWVKIANQIQDILTPYHHE